MANRSFVALLALAAALPLHAVANTFCVGTVGALESALVSASGNNQDNDILVQQGTYALTNTVFYDGNGGHSLHLLGGYTAGCSAAGRVLAPANTVLDATGASGQFLFNTRGGDLTIEGLRWTKLNAPGLTGLALHQLDGYYGGKLTFRFNEIDHGSAGPALVELYVLNEVELSTNLVHDNTATDAIQLNGYGLAHGGRIVHNTVSANSGVGLHTDIAWRMLPLSLYNNILFGNSGAGLRVSKDPVFALNNTINSVIADGAQTYVTGSAGNSTSNPSLLPGTYGISSGSTALNSGVPFADAEPAQDILGVKRWYGSSPDRGAYEIVYSDLASFVVTKSGDSGTGTLRDAIHQANQTGGPSLITFQIGASCGPGGAPTVISLLSALENITVPLVIRGYSQPGAHANTLVTGFDAQLCIELSGSGTVDTALHIASGKPNARLDVSGIVFTWFHGTAVVLADGRGHYIHGNSFGVDAPGTGSVFPNAGNLLITGNARAATIGGPAASDRNLFGMANGAVVGNGMNLSSQDSYSVVRGNYIGTDSNGTVARGNSGSGIQILAGRHNLVAGNVIAANNVGIELVSSGLVDTSYNTIEANNIGVSATSTALGNNFAGIWVSAGATANNIGSSDPLIVANGNRISNNGGPGVWIDGTAGVYNGVFANAIGTNAGLAIDLDAQGHLANDSLDADAGPNDKQNYPVITRAIALTGGGMHVEGSLSAQPNTPYYISIYVSNACDASGYGPASSPVGTLPSATTNGTGQLSFSADVGKVSWSANGVVTATANDAGYNTSEISACKSYLQDRIFADGFEPPAPPPSK